jgi:hypothetical protein
VVAAPSRHAESAETIEKIRVIPSLAAAAAENALLPPPGAASYRSDAIPALAAVSAKG